MLGWHACVPKEVRWADMGVARTTSIVTIGECGADEALLVDQVQPHCDVLLTVARQVSGELGLLASNRRTALAGRRMPQRQHWGWIALFLRINSDVRMSFVSICE